MALRADDVDLGRDSYLVARFQAGDPDAFDDLYRRYFARLHRFCQRRVGDSNEAEELAQEAFVRALRAMPSLGGERRFYPWMTVIASRLCVDAHRRRGRSQPVADVDAGHVDADLSGPDNEVDREHLAIALERVAPRHREVLEFRELDGWSYQRIADHYGVTLGTVEALLHRARRALRREFLHIAGDTPHWVALPLVGWLGRRMVTARTRLATWGAELSTYGAPLTGAAVASVAVAVGAVTVLAPSHGAAGNVAASPRPVVAHVVAAVPELQPAEVVATETVAESAETFLGSDLAAPQSISLAGFQWGQPDAKAKAERSEIHQGVSLRDLNVVSVGVNPSSIAADVARVTGYATTIIGNALGKPRP